MRIGVINWDATYLPETYFGGYCSRSLTPCKYRERTPYYALVGDDGTVTFPPKTQESYDEELMLAKEAGIDYFAYVWYGEENQSALGYKPNGTSDCSGFCWELNMARHLYTASRLTDKPNMCAILAAHPLTDYDVTLLIYEMSRPYYERIDGKPLLYIFPGEDRITEIRRVKRMCSEYGLTPYVCYLGIPTSDFPYDEIDALSQYALCKSNTALFSDVTEEQIRQNTLRSASPVRAVIPGFTMGWNPMPRVERPCPWVSYPDTDYAGRPTTEELTDEANRLTEWILATPKARSGHILTFAWNEFEEGGWICPTVTDRANLDAFTEATKILHRIG